MLGEFRRRFLRRRAVADLRRESSGLRRTLGWVQLVALGVGAIVGAGIFVIIGDAAARLAGPAVSLSFVVVALASAIVAFAYAELAAMIPVGGSGYGYAMSALGELPAWLVGWCLVLAYLIGNGAIAAGFSANLKSLFLAAVGPLDAGQTRLVDMLTAAPPSGVADVPAALVVLAITFLIARPAAESVGAASFIVAAKVLVLVVFVVAALPSIRAENLTPFFPYGAGGVLAGAAVAFFAFLGFDTVSTAAEEVKDPSRDLPRGIVGSLVVCAVLYVVVALAMTGAVRYSLLGTADPLAEVMRVTGRPALAVVMNLGGLLATLTVLIAFQFGGARVVLNLARDGFIPERLARVSARTGTPLVTTYTVGLVVAVAAALLPLQVLVDVTNIATLLAFAAVLACVVVLRRIEPAAPRPFRMPLVPLLPLVGIGLLLTILATVRAVGTWFGFLAWIGLGLLVYGAYRAPRTRGA